MTLVLLTKVVLLSVSSFLGGIPAGLYAVIGTLIGTIGLKIVETWFNKNKDRNEVRRDLNSEINSLQTRLDKVEEEVTFWRSRFYEEQEQGAVLRVLAIKAGLELPEKIVNPPRKD